MIKSLSCKDLKAFYFSVCFYSACAPVGSVLGARLPCGAGVPPVSDRAVVSCKLPPDRAFGTTWLLLFSFFRGAGRKAPGTSEKTMFK